ncbi:hypothetical protein HY624_00605 [Candidatus Uhrbacteria bacterium]|nr:hypothetical protein [Candidatus Uhrbacteria bacterium]
MKNFVLIVAVMFMAAGCVTGSVGEDGTMHASAFGTSLGELSNVQRTTVETDIRRRNADADAEEDRKIRYAQAMAAVRKAEAEAQILEAYAGRINPADGSRLKELLALEKELFAAWAAEEGQTRASREKKLSLFDEIQEVRQLVSDFLDRPGTPAGFGGMGGLPMMMPGMGISGPIAMGSGIQRDPTHGRFVNEADGAIRVVVNGTETWVQPQDAVAMILPPGNYRYTAQRFINTAAGTVASAIIGGDFQVDNRWDESIHQGWELRFRPWAFPR